MMTGEHPVPQGIEVPVRASHGNRRSSRRGHPPGGYPGRVGAHGKGRVLAGHPLGGYPGRVGAKA